MKTSPSRPTTSSTTNQVLSGSCAVFSTAPIQATKCATAANNNSNTASAIKPSRVHDKTPDLIPVTSGPLMMKMSLRIARANVMPTNTNPATSPSNTTSASTHLYWGREWYVWNNNGDKVILRRADGSLKDTCSYSGAGSKKYC